MGDMEENITTPNVKTRVDNVSNCCGDNADATAGSRPSAPASSTKEDVFEDCDVDNEGQKPEMMCGEASMNIHSGGSEKTQNEVISNQSFADSSGIETLQESSYSIENAEPGQVGHMQSSVNDINTPPDPAHGVLEQNMQLDEMCAPRDRVSYDSDDQVTLKSDNLTYSTKVASEQSTDSEGNEAIEGSEGGSRVISSESECDTYKYTVPQQDDCIENVTQRTLNKAAHLESDDNDNQCDGNSLEDAEALLNDGSVSPARPHSLSLPRPVQCKEKPRHAKRGSESSSHSGYSCSSSTDALIEAVASVPLQGTITRDGDMIAFIAEDLNNMIKMSSPISKTDDSSSASLSGRRTPRSASFGSMSSSASGWSVSASSASGWSYSAMSRSPSIVTQSPEDVPPIDPRVVDDLQVQANNVAENLRHMMNTLQNHMQKMSAVTYSCLDIYRESVDNTCNCVDSSIKSMYALMAKNEELARAMQPVNELHEQIKEINRLLDVFDLQMAREEK